MNIRKIIVRLTFMLFLSFILTTSGILSFADSSQVVDYPNQSIRGYIAASAGGATDSTARAISSIVEDILGVSFILTNLGTGAGGGIAARQVYDLPADGYSILFGSEASLTSKILGLSEIDFLDFETIMLLSYCPSVIVVPANSPYDTIDELIQAARENPGKINVGTSGLNGGPFAAFTAIGKIEGVEWNLIHYEGESLIVTPLMNNELDASSFTLPFGTQYIESGDLKALGLLSDKKSKYLPDVPVLGDIKPQYKEFMDYTVFYGAFVHPDTPKDRIAILVNAFQEAIDTEKWGNFLENTGFSELGLTGEEAREYLNRWRSYMSWLFYEAGVAKLAPDEIGIPRP